MDREEGTGEAQGGWKGVGGGGGTVRVGMKERRLVREGEAGRGGGVAAGWCGKGHGGGWMGREKGKSAHDTTQNRAGFPRLGVSACSTLVVRH